MAGTGNLEVLRLCRCLRSRICQASNTVVTYGSHLATHMALGLLFFGGGRYTLSTSAESVAALIIAFYPKFPTHSNDNRSGGLVVTLHQALNNVFLKYVFIFSL